jgi:enoyl-CoA hydratase/carnithine racemase
MVRRLSGEYSSTVSHALEDDGVLLLTLNRPERNNAWNREMEGALHGMFEEASESEDVRVVVVTGAGRAFCPGLDSEDLDRVSRPGQSFEQTGRRPVLIPTLVPKPVICAINGACAGLGLITALMSDVRFAARDAKITTAFARRGLPAEEAISWILPRIVGHATALDLLLSSRVVLGAEAAEIGLVHRAFPAEELLPAAMAYARDIATQCSPVAVAAAKRQVYEDWDRTLAESRLESRRLVGVLKAASPDFREGVQSFVERRPARFASFGDKIDYRDYPDYQTGAPS